MNPAVAIVGVPPGSIVIWSGDSNSIPAGWNICDGTKGTPDLRNLFVLGAGGTYYDGDAGGQATVTLTESQLPAHSHGYEHWVERDNNWKSGGNSSPGDGTGGTYYDQTGTTGGGEAVDILPPFVALYYIMLL